MVIKKTRILKKKLDLNEQFNYGRITRYIFRDCACFITSPYLPLFTPPPPRYSPLPPSPLNQFSIHGRIIYFYSQIIWLFLNLLQWEDPSAEVLKWATKYFGKEIKLEKNGSFIETTPYLDTVMEVCL